MNISEKKLEILCIGDIPRIISEEHPIKFRCYLDNWDIDRMAQDYKVKINEIIKLLSDEGAIDILYEDYVEYKGSLTDFVRDSDEEWLGIMLLETAEYIYVDSIIRDSAPDMLSDCFMILQNLTCPESSHKLNNTVLSDNTSDDIQIANFFSFSPIS